MLTGGYKQGVDRRSAISLGGDHRYAWKEQTYPVPTPSRKGFQWKASAFRSIQRIKGRQVAGHPVTIMVPAVFSFMPAESVALGWLNEIDALGTIRQRIIASSRVTGWDVFTFHTLHNLDHYFDSTIAAVRETWLREGRLSSDCVHETQKKFGRAYEYHRIQARLVENLVLQSSLMEWLSVHASDAPLRYHVIGTGLASALVWSGALSFSAAISAMLKIGARWDASITALAEEELGKKKATATADNLGWLRFHKVRQIIEGRQRLRLAVSPEDLPAVDAPSHPFWYSATAADEPVLLETSRDAQNALEAMNLSSWSPAMPRPLQDDRVRGWLISGLHPMASACRWSFSNYLLATPESSLLFLDHIATLGKHYLTVEKPAPSKPFPAIQDKRHRALIG